MDIYHGIIWIVLGYLSGSILYARLAERIFHKDIVTESKDQNPGAANAFMKGGFWCGLATLLGDLGKGFLPIWCYLMTVRQGEPQALMLAFVMAAPVIGHIFPIFFAFKGGKGIATSFGCLMGLAPDMKPVLILAFVFLFLSLVFRIKPHFYRTIAAYFLTAVIMCLAEVPAGVCIGFLFMCLAVIVRMHFSTEIREKIKVEVLWKH